MSVLIVDLEGLSCIEASASGFNRSGCRILTDRVGELRETIGLRVNGLEKMIRGRITSVSNGDAQVTFEFEDEKPKEKRKENRRQVRIPAQVSDRRGGIVIRCIIVDASKSGCRLDARDLDLLPDDVLLHIVGLDLPVNGRIAWRSPGCAGVELLWQFTKSHEFKTPHQNGAGHGGDAGGPGGAEEDARTKRRTGGAFGVGRRKPELN
ncbi:PilZ domain-containing protein [Roseibium sp.]|uniref:PilZ domain-containing protein n=1 Tax=Roseibium sp. TaxID=1936156 RepID=UPI003A96FECB